MYEWEPLNIILNPELSDECPHCGHKLIIIPSILGTLGICVNHTSGLQPSGIILTNYWVLKPKGKNVTNYWIAKPEGKNV